MKAFFKQYIQRYLIFLAQRYLRKTKPDVIGITGSFGKTSAKEAIYTVLKERFRVLESKKNLNTEIGMPLAILGLSSGFSSPLLWLWILMIATVRGLLPSKNFDVLILEYAADKPGDIEYLIQIAKPHISVLTGIGPVHLDKGQFKNTDDILNEKKKLITCLAENDLAIIYGDDELLRTLLNPRNAGQLFPIQTYGLLDRNTIYATDIQESIKGTKAVAHVNNSSVPMELSALGKHHAALVLPAILIGLYYKMDMTFILNGLKKFRLPPGRMNRIEGVNGSILIDSSYNASPKTMRAALEFLQRLSFRHGGQANRKIAVLGNMNELGEYTERAHGELAPLAAQSCDILITVGNNARLIAEESLKNGFPERSIKSFETAAYAGKYLKTILADGDVVLFKGSQNNVRLENAIKLVMAHPEDAPKLLCRQESNWLRI